MSTDWRALCEELTEHLALLDEPPHELVCRAQNALAQPEPEVVGPSELRVALQQAAHELDVAENALLCSSFHNAATRAKQAARTARAVLSQPEPEVVEPSDEELLELMDKEFRSDAAALVRMAADKRQESTGVMRNVLNYHIAQYARAVLARWCRPAPASAGEVGELVVDELVRQLRTKAAIERTNSCHYSAALLTRAADLLEQRQAAPAPVASDTRYEFSVLDEDYTEQAGGTAPSYAQALSEGQRYLAQYQQDGPHALEVRRVEVLPLPIGEVAA